MNLSIPSFSSVSTRSFRSSFMGPIAKTQSNKPTLNGHQASSKGDVCSFKLGNVEKLSARANQGALRNGWICNVSAGYKFSTCAPNQIQLGYEKVVKPLLNAVSVNYAVIAEVLIEQQFKYLCLLLIAGNCKTLYFDAAFTQAQFETIRKLQIYSGTELVNARLAFMFANIQQA